MLISKEWLSEYVALPAEISAAELAFRFSLATAEIEGVVDAGAAFENIVVGVIESVGPHPGADPPLAFGGGFVYQARQSGPRLGTP